MGVKVKSFQKRKQPRMSKIAALSLAFQPTPEFDILQE